jgi:hypothetical protein
MTTADLLVIEGVVVATHGRRRNGGHGHEYPVGMSWCAARHRD